MRRNRGTSMIEFAILCVVYVVFLFALLDAFLVLHSVNGMNYGLFQAMRFGVTSDGDVTKLNTILNRNFSLRTFLFPSTTSLTCDGAANCPSLGIPGRTIVYKIIYKYNYLSKFITGMDTQHSLEVTSVNEPD